jgi:superfamily II DNA helicase RecQ
VHAGVTRIICATVAFGMGMDIPGIRFIVHWDAAQSLHQFVQQIGRGGRCGCPCLCMTMYDRQFITKCFRRASQNSDKSRRQADLRSLNEVRALALEENGTPRMNEENEKVQCCRYRSGIPSVESSVDTCG